MRSAAVPIGNKVNSKEERYDKVSSVQFDREITIRHARNRESSPGMSVYEMLDS